VAQDETEHVEIAAEGKKYNDKIKLTVRWKKGKSAVFSEASKEMSVGQWFDTKGTLSYRHLKKDLDKLLAEAEKKKTK